VSELEERMPSAPAGVLFRRRLPVSPNRLFRFAPVTVVRLHEPKAKLVLVVAHGWRLTGTTSRAS